MNLNDRIEAFSKLGEILRNSLAGRDETNSVNLNKLIDNQYLNNPWFTPENVRMAVKAIADELKFENLTKWTNAYPDLDLVRKPLNVVVIMPGNIPLAGFHDLICVLISDNNITAKTSSKDSELIVFIGDILCQINPDFRKRIRFTEGFLADFEAVIATGSDNNSRYFEYYFGKFPNIIRRNRNSIAIIEGNETDTELQALGTDIFSYFGLGCRNVSKIYVPDGYDFTKMTNNWISFSEIIKHTKYSNNYNFSRAVYMVNKENFIDTGFLLIKENPGLSSPVAVLHFEYYNSYNYVLQQTQGLNEKIQCIVGRNNIPFGQAQEPHLWDYADGIDTIEFLLKKIFAGIK